jgi:large subunit ribosomal protein L7/L12
LKAITGLGLKEAKDLVESSSKATPKVLKKDIKKEEAETLKAKLAESGAVIEIV